MSIRIRNCSVPNCDDRDYHRHSIPVDPQVRALWLQRIGNPQFYKLPPEKLRARRICNLHFAEMCFDCNNKLKKYALPTRNLPVKYEESEETCFAFPWTPIHEPAMPQKFQDLLAQFNTATPSTFSFEASAELKVTAGFRTYRRKRKFPEPQPSTSSTFHPTSTPPRVLTRRTGGSFIASMTLTQSANEMKKVDSAVHRMRKKNPQLQKGNNILDSDQIFGDYVASELRNLKNSENKRKLKHIINHAIMQMSNVDASSQFVKYTNKTYKD